MQWHARLGYAVLACCCSASAGGSWAGAGRVFRASCYSPRSVIAHVRGQAHPDHLVGHNPMGALSVLAMLAFLLIQVGTGLVGDDEISFTGPLNRFVDTAKGLAATWYHKRVGQWVIVGLVVLHVAAVLFYLWKKRDNLIGPMLHGDKVLAGAVAPSRDDMASRMTALVVLAACGGSRRLAGPARQLIRGGAPSDAGDLLRALRRRARLEGLHRIRQPLGNATDAGSRAADARHVLQSSRPCAKSFASTPGAGRRPLLPEIRPGAGRPAGRIRAAARRAVHGHGGWRSGGLLRAASAR